MSTSNARNRLNHILIIGAVLAAGVALTACGESHLANGQPCIPTNALGTTIDNPNPASGGKAEVVTASPGDIITMRLTIGVAYAGAPRPQSPPLPFPWLTPQSSDGNVLQPVAMCPFPGYTVTLPQTITAFKAIRSGQATIVARLDPAYPNPPPGSGLQPLQSLKATVVVGPAWVPWALRLAEIGGAVLLLWILFQWWRGIPAWRRRIEPR